MAVPWQPILYWSARLFWAYICYVCFTVIYNVFLSPLRKIPGPRLAAATRLPLTYHKLCGTAEAWVLGLHETYGDVVRPAPTEVSFATSKALRSIYGYAPGSKFAVLTKDPKFYEYGDDAPAIHIVRDPHHSRHRKAFSPAFSEKALLQQQPLVSRYVTQLISNLHQACSDQADAKIDISENYNFCMFDIMADLTFGEPLGLLQNSSYIPWVEMIFASLKWAAVIGQINNFPWLSIIARQMVPKALTEKMKQHAQFSNDRVDKRLANGNPRPDIWGSMLNSKDEQQLSLKEMHADGNMFMMAGTETSATLLSGITYYLLSSPTALTTLQTEIRQAFKSSEDINSISLSKLPYMNACIEEGLRIYPPVPTGLPRLVGRGGTELCGYYIPEHTTVYVHIYSNFHNSRNFADPHSYYPERWLKQNSEARFANDDRASFQPFSVGPRNCIGINLAYLEVRLTLAHMIYNFDMSLCEESQDWNKQRVFILWEKGPLMVNLKPIKA